MNTLRDPTEREPNKAKFAAGSFEEEVEGDEGDEGGQSSEAVDSCKDLLILSPRHSSDADEREEFSSKEDSAQGVMSSDSGITQGQEEHSNHWKNQKGDRDHCAEDDGDPNI